MWHSLISILTFFFVTDLQSIFLFIMKKKKGFKKRLKVGKNGVKFRQCCCFHLYISFFMIQTDPPPLHLELRNGGKKASKKLLVMRS